MTEAELSTPIWSRLSSRQDHEMVWSDRTRGELGVGVELGGTPNWLLLRLIWPIQHSTFRHRADTAKFQRATFSLYVGP